MLKHHISPLLSRNDVDHNDQKKVEYFISIAKSRSSFCDGHKGSRINTLRKLYLRRSSVFVFERDRERTHLVNEIPLV